MLRSGDNLQARSGDSGVQSLSVGRGKVLISLSPKHQRGARDARILLSQTCQCALVPSTKSRNKRAYFRLAKAVPKISAQLGRKFDTVRKKGPLRPLKHEPGHPPQY